MNPFSADQPAASVRDVIDYLEAEFQPGDLFRGQIKDYPALVPSTYRAGVIAAEENGSIIAIDEDRVFGDWDRHKRLRWTVLNGLIGELGIGFGNLLAQQYGLTSECIDVTEEPSIAAFFGTRTWPEDRHFPGPGIGVMYRWRGLGKEFQPKRFTLSALDGWFQMGKKNDLYFDSFVRDGAWVGTFDRDHWFNWEAGEKEVVSTLPLVMRWTEIIDLVVSERGINPVLNKSNWELTRENVLRADWRLSRVAGQKGGFIRPAIYWNASVPTRSRIAHSAVEMQRIYSRGQIWPQFGESNNSDGYLPWPRIVPSLAIKRTVIGLENMRLHPACERFYFQHSETTVGGLYRHELWPEPAEDPVYAILWNYALIWLMRAHSEDDEMPAVDDINGGLLDRGYRGRGEVRTRDSRNLDEVARSMLEDAAEHLLSPQGTGLDASRASVALAQLGQRNRAMKAAIDGVRRFPKSTDALLALASTLNHAGKKVWAARALRTASVIDPLHPLVLHGLAFIDMENMRYTDAASRLDQALARFDPLAQRNLEEDILFERAIVAGVLGEETRFAQVCSRLRDLAFDDPEELVAEQVRQRREALRRKDQIFKFRPQNSPGGAASSGEG